MNGTAISEQGLSPIRDNVNRQFVAFFIEQRRSADNENTSSDELMPKSVSKKVASLTGTADQPGKAVVEPDRISLDDMAEICRSMLLDDDLEVSKVRPFFWSMVEAYVDRFQVFPFDVNKALFSYLELSDYPEQEMRDLVKRLEKLYRKQHGSALRDSDDPPVGELAGAQTLDEEISGLRETLKYAAIVGERLDE